MPHIRVLLGYQQGQVYSLDSRPTIIGRDPSCTLILDPESPASRRHAEISFLDGEWVVRDLGSRNGTRVNDARIVQCPLNHADEILVGDNLFVFEYSDRCTSETEAAASRAMPKSPLGVQNDPETQKLVKSMAEKTMRMERELSRVMGGSAGIVRDVFTAILAGGHILLLGPSATTKELVCDAAQRMLGLKTGRARLSLTIPMSDVAGADIVEASPSTGETEPRLLAGPLFSQLFMAEDINRASPKIQSVVFAAMNERRILLTERTWPMPEPFCVVATQESSDWDGNCPLKPDSLDRIMFSVVAEPGGPDTLSHAPFESIICSDNVRTLYSVIRDFAVDESLVQTAVLIACATRPTHSNAPEIVKQHVATGAGPNAAYALLMGAKTRAVLAGRLYATEDDLRSVSLAALRHRISLAASAPAAGVDIPRVIRKVFDAVLAPATSAAH